MSMQPGWYPDPFSSGGYVRWWDGQRWGASAAAPTDAAPAPGPGAVGSAGAADPLTPVPMPPPAAPGVPAYGAPYGAPAQTAAFPLATWGSRAIARIIDTLIESVLTAPLFVWLLWPAFRDFVDAIPEGASAPPEAALATFQTQVLAISLTLSLVSAAITFVYEVPQNVLWGRTIGKRIMGIRIRPLVQDVPLTWLQATIRWGTYTAGALVAGGFFTILDYLWPLWDKPWRQALHDKPAKTVVVPTR